jgi:hypothetical protein
MKDNRNPVPSSTPGSVGNGWNIGSAGVGGYGGDRPHTHIYPSTARGAPKTPTSEIEERDDSQ